MKTNSGDTCSVRTGSGPSSSASVRFLVPILAIVTLVLSGAVNAEDSTAGSGTESVLVRIPVGSAAGEIGVVADVPNLEPQGPAAITANPETSDVFVLDTVNGRLVQALPAVPAGDQLPSVDLTSDDPVKNVEYASDLLFANNALYVLDSMGRKVVKYSTGGEWMETFPIKNPAVQTEGSATLVVLANDDIRIREAGVTDLPIDPAGARGTPVDKDSLSTPRGDQVLSSKLEWSAGGNAVQLDIASKGPGRAIAQTIDVKSKEALASVELVGIDGRERYYVLASELDKADRMHTALARYSSSGELEAVADIPVDDVVFLPNRFVTIDDKGTAYFLQPLSTEVLVVELTFEPRAQLTPPEGAAYEPRSRATVPVVDEGFVAAVEEAAKDEPYEAPRGKISRRQILDNARQFLNMKWTVSPGNYGSDANNNCSAPRNWRRPKRLNGKLGQAVTAAPYRWGGFMSQSSIASKLASGAVAGDVCTCRSASRGYCISSGTVGVDCSGFVSQSLQEKYHTTTGMSAITTPLDGLRSLKAGDILNRSGSHVRLVAEDVPKSGPLVIRTIESAVSCGGVCEATYSATQLSKYKPLRYKYVQESSAAAPAPTTPQATRPASGTAAQTTSEKPAAQTAPATTPNEPNFVDQLQSWFDRFQDQFMKHKP